MRYPTDSNHYPLKAIDGLNRQLGDLLDADVMVVIGDLIDGVDDEIRAVVEDLKRQGSLDKLCVVLRTQGGYIEVVERIVGTLRHHFNAVEFIVPNYAYSAGTALVLSGDAIWMNYYSRLGPIDPQIRSVGGRPVPAIGYLARYESILETVKAGNASSAEIALLLEFDQAELYSFDQSRRLAIRLVTEWLTTYKFKHWTWSESLQREVTPDLRRQRATKIATELSDPERWNSHGYGISMDVLRELGLKIDDFNADQQLKHAIEDYYRLLENYLQQLGLTDAIHVYGRLAQVRRRHR